MYADAKEAGGDLTELGLCMHLDAREAGGDTGFGSSRSSPSVGAGAKAKPRLQKAGSISGALSYVAPCIQVGMGGACHTTRCI